jgi:hypothetical protein
VFASMKKGIAMAITTSTAITMATIFRNLFMIFYLL